MFLHCVAHTQHRELLTDHWRHRERYRRTTRLGFIKRFGIGAGHQFYIRDKKNYVRKTATVVLGTSLK